MRGVKQSRRFRNLCGEGGEQRTTQCGGLVAAITWTAMSNSMHGRGKGDKMKG